MSTYQYHKGTRNPSTPAPASAAARAIPPSVVREAFQKAQPGLLNDFEAAQQEVKVEHLSVTGFLRRIPHKWHLEDIQRFGSVVGKTADAVQCAYITASDMALGVIRVFPRPLLARVYEILAPQFCWPAPEGALAIDDPRRPAQETLRAHERVSKHLKTVLAAVAEAEVRNSITVVLQFLEQDAKRMSAEAQAASSAADLETPQS